MKGLQVAPLYFGLAWNPGIPFVRRYGLAISRAEAFEDLCLHDRQWFRQSCKCPRKAFHTKWRLALCRSAPARIKHYPEQRDLFTVRSIAPRSKNIGSTAGTVVTVPSIPHCPVSWAKRSEMACDLSPNVHPAIESCSHLSLRGSVKQRDGARSPRCSAAPRPVAFRER